MALLHGSTYVDLSRFFQRQPNIFLAKYLPFSIYRKYLSMAGLYYYGIHGAERRDISRAMSNALGNDHDLFTFLYLKVKTYLGIFDHYCEKMINAQLLRAYPIDR